MPLPPATFFSPRFLRPPHSVDDDNEPAPHLMQVTRTWASVFPNAVIAECGWNVSCITNRVPHMCGEGYEVYLFVRQDHDVMCFPESLPLYNFHECLSPVDKSTVRSTDVVMGVSNPLYRRGMFGDDFLDIAKIVAKRKIRKMLHAHYDAVGETHPDEELEHLTMDQAQELRVRAAELSVNSVHSKPSSDAHEAALKLGLEPGGEAAAAAAEAERKANVLSPELLSLAHDALKHPDLTETAHLLRWKRANPPDALFLVDDVYISAYLACRGVPRFVVPSTNSAITPVPREERVGELPPQPPRPPGPDGQRHHDLSAINALHGESHFNQGNREILHPRSCHRAPRAAQSSHPTLVLFPPLTLADEAVRFFRQVGCWN
jgi:hypothetical protein